MAPPANEAAVYPASYGSGNLWNHGGPVIGNAGFWALYWIFSVVQQYGASITSTVHNWGYYVAAERTKSSISDSGIRNFIAGVLNSGTVNVATNIIYGVYLPAGMKVTMNGGASCSTFCGYHGHFNYGGLDIRYAVFPYLNCSACKLSNLSVADMMTIVASHEIREAVTDPQLNAWYDDQGYEADDKCAWHNLYRMARRLRGATGVLQWWRNGPWRRVISERRVRRADSAAVAGRQDSIGGRVP